MRYKMFFSIFFICICVSYSQNGDIIKKDFSNYVNLFQSKILPISVPIDYQELEKEIEKGKNLEINDDFVAKYILLNKKQKWDRTIIQYQHLFCISKRDKFIALIYSKSNLEPPITEGLNLFETFLITYDYNGNYISSKVITQESERRYMISTISNNLEIESKSICVKNKGINWPKILDADIIKEKYKIENNGKIMKISTTSKKGLKVGKEKTLDKLIKLID